MKYCTNCGHELVDEAVVCPVCGVKAAAPAAEDKISVGLVILAVLIPLFGIIYWPVKHKETPRRARACGIAAIISWVLSIAFSIVSTVITTMMLVGA